MPNKKQLKEPRKYFIGPIILTYQASPVTSPDLTSSTLGASDLYNFCTDSYYFGKSCSRLLFGGNES